MTAVIGSLAAGCVVFLTLVTRIEPRISRPWVRHRLQPSRTETSTHMPSTPAPLELASLLESVARTMQAGSSLSHSLIHAADTHPTLISFTEPIVLGLMRGLNIASAIDDVESTTLSPDAKHAMRALALASLNNTPSVVHHGASLIRERIALLEERNTRTAQAQASLRVLTRSPLVVFALIVVMSTSARQFLVSTAAGLTCIAVGTALHLAGRRWMRTLIDRAAP